jgi:hypothetical protein
MGKYLDYPNCSNEVTDGWVNYKNSPFECTIHRLMYPTLIMGCLSIVITLAKIFKVTFSLLMWGKLNRFGSKCYCCKMVLLFITIVSGHNILKLGEEFELPSSHVATQT